MVSGAGNLSLEKCTKVHLTNTEQAVMIARSGQEVDTTDENFEVAAPDPSDIFLFFSDTRDFTSSFSHAFKLCGGMHIKTLFVAHTEASMAAQRRVRNMSGQQRDRGVFNLQAVEQIHASRDSELGANVRDRRNPTQLEA